uniref:transmembrane protein 106B-like isoform X4 n=1 Tax=Myxine glutinosa TaxID=7769 RepID=UPI00358E788A
MSILNNDSGQVSGQKRDWRSNSLNCPTCNGTGRIGSERANELVALIPCSDKRLKPRRLTFYITISIVTCMVLCSLIVFFIYPRAICISDLSINNSTASTPSNLSVFLNFTLQGTIHNGNFYSIKVLNITYDTTLFANAFYTTDKQSFTIPARSSRKKEAFMILELHGRAIFEYCTMEYIKVQIVLLEMSETVTVSALWQNMQGSQHASHYVDCHVDRPSHAISLS